MTSSPVRILALTLALGACEAGPSAFDRPREAGPLDTASVAALPDVPMTARPDSALLDDTTGPSGASGAAAGAVPAAPEPGPTPLHARVPSSSADAGPDGPAARADGSEGRAGSPPRAFPRPDAVRGIYLNAWASGSSRRSAELIDLAARTEVNAFVIDIKDATGYVSYDSEVPLAREIGATGEIRIRDLPGLLDRLSDAGIYPIARIVIVKDPLLAAARPDWAVQDTAGGVWTDGKGFVWLNPFDERVWAYHVELAREVAAMGVPEIQWDYVRFPDAPRSELERAVFPGADGRAREDAIAGFLAYSREALAPLGVTVTADVFGVTTSVSRDVGIGQVWESFIDDVDVALPMVYPSHYWTGSFGIDTPNAHPYEVVRAALSDAVRRSDAVDGAGTTRPWLQDFTLGAPRYEAPEVRAQIQATYDAGIDEWILWNPSSRYTEAALEPVGGFDEPPLMRVGGEVVSLHRHVAMADSARRMQARADSLAAVADSQPPLPPTGGPKPRTPR